VRSGMPSGCSGATSTAAAPVGEDKLTGCNSGSAARRGHVLWACPERAPKGPVEGRGRPVRPRVRPTCAGNPHNGNKG
jgi:hypothetical protein